MMEVATLIGMIIAKANGVHIPWWCWGILILWSAIHLGVAWFWTDEI